MYRIRKVSNYYFYVYLLKEALCTLFSGNICEILVTDEVVEKQKRLKWLNCVHTDIRKQYKNRIDDFKSK